jgi:hypothetical protein
MTRTTFVTGWIAVSLLAETIAIAFAALVAGVPAAIAIVVLVEGALLGLGQRRLLRAVHAGLERGWLWPTLAGAALGRCVELVTGGDPLSVAAGDWSAGAQYGAGIGVGAFAGAAMALPQAFVLRDRIDGAGWWVAARAAAWAFALPLLMVAGDAVAAHATAAPALVVLAVVGVFAGVAATVGAIEALVMERLLRPLRVWSPSVPARRGRPSDRAVVLWQELPIGAYALRGALRKAAPRLRAASLRGEVPLAVDLHVPTRDESAYAIALERRDERVPVMRFEGELRVDAVGARRSRLVIEGRYAAANGERWEELVESGSVEDAPRAVLERLARDVERENRLEDPGS